jgi:hypothetical protein
MITNFQKSKSFDAYFRNLSKYEKLIYNSIRDKSISLFNRQIIQLRSETPVSKSSAGAFKNTLKLPQTPTLSSNNVMLVVVNRFLVLQTSLKYCLKNLIQKQ